LSKGHQGPRLVELDHAVVAMFPAPPADSTRRRGVRYPHGLDTGDSDPLVGGVFTPLHGLVKP